MKAFREYTVTQEDIDNLDAFDQEDLHMGYIVVQGCYHFTRRMHVWYSSRFCRNRVCEVCGMMPLDSEDYKSDCPGKEVGDNV